MRKALERPTKRIISVLKDIDLLTHKVNLNKHGNEDVTT